MPQAVLGPWVVTVLCCFLVACPAAEQVVQFRKGPLVLHKAGDTIPSTAQREGVASVRYDKAASAQTSGAATRSTTDFGLGYGQQAYVVGFTEASEEVLAAFLKARGAAISAYLPDNAWVVLANASVIEEAQQLYDVPMALLEADFKLVPEWEPLYVQAGSPVSMHRRQLRSDNTTGVFEGTPVLLSEMTTLPSDDPLLAPRYGITVVLLAGVPDSAAAEARLSWPAALEEALGLGASGACEPVVSAADGATVWRVYVCAQHLEGAVTWIAQQRVVEAVEPAWRVRPTNIHASAAIQTGSTQYVSDPLAAESHPYWQLGLDGTGEIGGAGDSGLDVTNCYFYDPDNRITRASFNGTKLYRNPNHRKIVQYYAYADFGDDTVGHGTHTSGSIGGARKLFATTSSSPSDLLSGLEALVGTTTGGDAYVVDNVTGMAPGAKLAFYDLGLMSNTRNLLTPDDLGSYHQVQYDGGVRVDSDSWGTNYVTYTSDAANVDRFLWRHPDYANFVAAGNAGNQGTPGSTVGNPGNAKNVITVGSTYNTPVMSTSLQITGKATDGSTIYNTQVVPCLDSDSPDISSLQPDQLQLTTAQPADGCSPLTNADAVAGKVAVVMRGGCYFYVKRMMAEAAGASALLVVDNVAGENLCLTATNPSTPSDVPKIPVGGLSQVVGKPLLTALAAARQGSIFTLGYVTTVLAGGADTTWYSSYGPTPDGRIKPDIVTPGSFVLSSVSGTVKAGEQCHTATARYEGTSMSTPVAAGNALLVRQYFRQGFYPAGSNASTNTAAAAVSSPFEPSGMLLKAVLIGGAIDLGGGVAWSVGRRLAPAPDRYQGWGRMSLPRTIPAAGVPQTPTGWNLQVLDMVTITDKATHTYKGLSGAGGQLIITLVWYDFPAAINAPAALLNDLDLTVTVNGVTYFGNGGTRRDSINTVERVVIPNVPLNAAVTITVTAVAIRSRTLSRPFAALPQRYALSVHGRFGGFIDSPFNPAAAKLRAASLGDGTSGTSGAASPPPARKLSPPPRRPPPPRRSPPPKRTSKATSANRPPPKHAASSGSSSKGVAHRPPPRRTSSSSSNGKTGAAGVVVSPRSLLARQQVQRQAQQVQQVQPQQGQHQQGKPVVVRQAI